MAAGAIGRAGLVDAFPGAVEAAERAELRRSVPWVEFQI
jgi:hypothetical protein